MKIPWRVERPRASDRPRRRTDGLIWWAFVSEKRAPLGFFTFDFVFYFMPTWTGPPTWTQPSLGENLAVLLLLYFSLYSLWKRRVSLQFGRGGDFIHASHHVLSEWFGKRLERCMHPFKYNLNLLMKWFLVCLIGKKNSQVYLITLFSLAIIVYHYVPGNFTKMLLEN